ncbi:HAD-IIIA family hydrolase [Spirillospora albida]|uniref:HAD-IIIA family hydrolase n=1 Tax=Spirillospora albida TaxID=58123 RepID=UPI0004C273E5|nr:HAD-IIIA family hydrolase [Spirillospora albida]
MSCAVVVPTIGRASLRAVLEAVQASAARGPGPAPDEIIVVDDRPRPDAPPPPFPAGPVDVRVLRSGGRGPAAARNTGWRAAATEWVAFLDDDVVPGPEWTAKLAGDLAGLPADVAGTQGRVTVPAPDGRRPTDLERGTAGLASARWITADMAYRRDVLAAAGGFDERFRRAYREDADLALRVLAAGHRLVRGGREVAHPVRGAGFWASVRAQAGNADDVLMWRLHGRGWRARAGEGRGMLRHHLLATGAGLLALAAAQAALAGRRAPEPTVPPSIALTRNRRAAAHAGGGTAAAAAAGAGAVWLALTARFAWTRVRPGPRTPGEIVTMAVTSAVIPPAAVWHRLRGLWRHRRAAAWAGSRVVLFDRDDTLIRDVPYNGDPARVEPVRGARQALDRLRSHGARIGVVSNQSGVAGGRITIADVRAVNARVDELLGPFDAWEFCPHGPGDRCACRKPAPGMIERAARRLGAPPDACTVVGDIGADVEAAAAAGARGILVPTGRTRPAEIARAREVVPTLAAAVALILEGRGPR